MQKYAVVDRIDPKSKKTDKIDYKHNMRTPARGSGRQVKVFNSAAEAKKFSGGGTIKKITAAQAKDPSALMGLFPEEFESNTPLMDTLGTDEISEFKADVFSNLDGRVQEYINLKKVEVGAGLFAGNEFGEE